MSKKTDKEQYPVEFPSRGNKAGHSPIVDVTENEIFPMDVSSPYQNTNRKSGAFDLHDNITEVVATEIAPDMAEQTIHGQQKQGDI